MAKVRRRYSDNCWLCEFVVGLSVLVLTVPKIKLFFITRNKKSQVVAKRKKMVGELPPTSSACNLAWRLLQPHRLPQISLFLTSAVIPVKLLPSQKHLQKIKLECCLQGIHLPDRHGEEGDGKGTGGGGEFGERQLVAKLLHIDCDIFYFFFAFESYAPERQ